MQKGETLGAKKNGYKVGTLVYWKWLGRKVFGKVIEVHFAPIVKEIKGKKIKRNGSSQNPAYLVQSKAENLALKLHTEIFPAQELKEAPIKMFQD